MKKKLSVCFLREVNCLPDWINESYAGYSDLRMEKVLSYCEIESREIEIFDSGVSVLTGALKQMPNHFDLHQSSPPPSETAQAATEETFTEEKLVDERTEIGDGCGEFRSLRRGHNALSY